MESTAYAVIGLARTSRSLRQRPGDGTLTRAMHWMVWHYQPCAYSEERHWLAKDRYRPYRLAQIIELISLLALVIDSE